MLENGGTEFPLRICERAWWLKVDLLSKRGGRQAKGPAPMEVGIAQVSSTSVGNGETRETPSERRNTKHKNDVETKDEALEEQARPVSEAGKITD